ncbi:MAG: hypothetical protein JO353_14035, partial [Phycisphaerae bacterium]|nr:hypothetical protein [Phycisphaerae bacterium]
MRLALTRFQISLRRIRRRMRSGSVLILVVALLVLMALIGTAFLSTTRNDRYATVQNTNNTETDLLLAGLKNIAKSVIVGSNFDPSQLSSGSLDANTFKPANGLLYHNWTAPDLYHQYTDDPNIGSIANDAWLSPRTPSAVVQTGGNTYIPVWPCISEPLIGNLFESPFVQNSAGVLLSNVAPTYNTRMTVDYVPETTNNPVTNQPNGRNTATQGSQLTPTTVSITNADGSVSTYPAFTINIYNSAGTATPYTYLAGDADGDGVADSGMFKLPVGQINGLTYYAAVRIIDNESAVDATTAVSRRMDFCPDPSTGLLKFTRIYGGVRYVYNGNFNLGDFPGNVGLAEMMHDFNPSGTTLVGGVSPWSGELSNWTILRLGGGTLASGIATQPPPLSSGTVYGTPIADDGTARNDFAYSTFDDFLNSQL